ncbi:hypothetical protein HIM_11136 [Hirsutella minnesotensis 3608]|uniref:Uncharacterized protein n=1 Tax=Hirsutella minnesotensis 3608 TaxID=1043627 RepID=A0A0F8A1J5_9HYPO|nr:hypothetical protein HIM_11136 [Hirsutella minnesotensis 3608]
MPARFNLVATNSISAAWTRRSSFAAVIARWFATSMSARFGLKESSYEDDYDKHKQDSLAKQRKGMGHWKPELASNSEEAVRADRLTAKENVSSLQERTKRDAEETLRAGTSVRDGL